MSTPLWKRLARRMRRLVAGGPALDNWPVETHPAMRLAEGGRLPPEDRQLADLAATVQSRPRTESRALFRAPEGMLPCWREEDLDPADPWLTSPDYYPLYHALFRELTARLPSPRMLEIGVRTGYMGVVYARALPADGSYLGVDPNIYLPDGLDRAGRSLAKVRAELPGFTYRLIEGSSHDAGTRATLRSEPRFHLIHVDGDHSLEGKIADLALASSVLSPGGFVLVDDWHHMASVPEAISRALKLGWFRGHAILPTMRGLAILS